MGIVGLAIRAQKVRERFEVGGVKEVLCSHCGERFYGTVTVASYAEGNAMLGGIGEQKREQAKERAARGFDRAGLKASCPYCGWLSKAGTVAQTTRATALAATVCFITFLIVPAVAGVTLDNMDDHHFRNQIYERGRPIVASWLCLSVVVCVFFGAKIFKDRNSPALCRNRLQQHQPNVWKKEEYEARTAQETRSKASALGTLQHVCEYCGAAVHYQPFQRGGLVECGACGEMCDIP